MYKIVASLGLVFLTASAFAQQKITPQEASKHVGDSLQVCGKIFGGTYLGRTPEKLTLLRIGDAYPNAPFTVVIPQELRDKLHTSPEVTYSEKTGCFTGKIILYKDKPEMVLSKPEQLVIEQ